MLIANTNQVEGEMLMCKPLRTHTTGENTSNYSYIWLKKCLNWKQRAATCTDGARSMAGKRVALLHTVKPLHRNALLATVSFIVKLLV
jgi:hypothetical protein